MDQCDNTTTYLSQIDEMFRQGKLIDAAKAIDQLLAAGSDDPRLLLRQSRLLWLRGRLPDAQQILIRALQIGQLLEGTLVEMARLARAMGQLAEAHQCYEHAWLARSAPVPWHSEWVDVLVQLHRHSEARQIAVGLCAAFPDRPTHWFQLGLALQHLGAGSAALDAYRNAQALDPTLPMLGNNVAALHIELQEYAVAKAILEDVIARDTTNFLAWTNLANVHLRLCDPAAALIAAERACALAPNYPIALQGLSNIHKELQNWSASVASAEHAVRCAPQDLSQVWGLAMLQLVRGDFHNGWRNHEARWQGSPELRRNRHNIQRPQWQGENLAGKTLFVWGEQGFGDSIQFLRFVPGIAARVRQAGGKLIYCCFAELVPLFQRALAAHAIDVLPHNAVPLPEFDYHLPLCSLPLLLGITAPEDLSRGAYLQASPERVSDWHLRLGGRKTTKVGLVWTGSRTHQRNPLRSIDPAAYAKAFGGLDSVEFHSLQLGADAEVDKARDAGLNLVDHAHQLTSFDETAALITSLDLVITVCTSAAHLAGALGIPTWVLLDVNPHWVWLLEREDSPWYPSVRLYRQTIYRDWDSVLEKVSADLQRLVDSCSFSTTDSSSMS